MRDKMSLGILKTVAGQSDSLVTGGTYKEVLATMRSCGYNETNFEQDGSNYESTFKLSDNKSMVIPGDMSDATISGCYIVETKEMKKSKLNKEDRSKDEFVMLVGGAQLNGGKDAQTLRDSATGIVDKYNSMGKDIVDVCKRDYVVSGDILMEHGVDIENDASRVANYTTYDDIIIEIHGKTDVEVTEDEIEKALSSHGVTEDIFPVNLDSMIKTMEANGVVFTDGE